METTELSTHGGSEHLQLTKESLEVPTGNVVDKSTAVLVVGDILEEFVY